MNIELNNKLLKNGYLSFQLDNETKEQLKQIANKLKKNEFTHLRHTGCGNSDSSFDSFENLEKLKNEYAPQKKWQVWYQDNNFRTKITDEEYSFIRNLFTSIIENLYPVDSYDKDFFINCTMYNKGCYINSHTDGAAGHRLTNILIYLNDDYIDGMGGEIIINKEKVKPELGNVAIIDFSKNNPIHEVTEVLDENFRRLTIIVELARNTQK